MNKREALKYLIASYKGKENAEDIFFFSRHSARLLTPALKYLEHLSPRRSFPFSRKNLTGTHLVALVNLKEVYHISYTKNEITIFNDELAAIISLHSSIEQYLELHIK